ncbi:glycosyltransferase family 4 protein [Lusitaniella coriacea]|uniref:glycosyltransferase family 4 protein n=1 Tax=Lusitaniella coriacea TaxID=1983105 RepID=UPI003CF25534
MNILMISSTLPYPPSRSGTEIRTFNLLKYLHQRHSITLITQRSKGTLDADVDALRDWVDNLVVFPRREGTVSQKGIGSILSKGSRFLESTIKGVPPNVLHRYSPEMHAWIDECVREGRCDAMTFEHSANAIYARPSYRGKAKMLVNVHSSIYWGTINYLKMGASENPDRDRAYLPTLKRYETNYCNLCDRIVVTTPDDKDQLLELSPDAKIEVIPNGVDLDLFPYRTTDLGGQGLIFVGAMDMTHNIDAVRFFVLQVLPALQERYPEATFTIAGGHPTKEVKALGERPGVIVTGRVPSMVEYLHKSTVCVIPLQTGFGIKNKTMEAMAAGVPVVGSDRGLEGLAVDGENVPLAALRANTVEEYVTAIGRLFDEPQLRQELAKTARSLIEEEFTWESAGSRYEKALMGE